MNGMSSALGLAARDLLRFGRQPSRIIASIGTPMVIWIFLGAGFGANAIPAPGGEQQGYAGYLLPGMATLVVMFSSIFGAMSLIEDRHEGFLQGALVSPAPRWSIVWGKLMAGAGIATAQGGALLLAGPLVGIEADALGYALALLGLALTSVALTGLGLALAWWVDSTHGFHGVMNLVLMPMWLLSGAFFSVESASPWMGWVMRLDPLYWLSLTVHGPLSGAGPGVEWAVSLGLIAIAVGGAWWVMARPGATLSA